MCVALSWQSKVPTSHVSHSVRCAFSCPDLSNKWRVSQLRKKVGRPESILLIRVLLPRELPSYFSTQILAKYLVRCETKAASVSNGEMEGDEATRGLRLPLFERVQPRRDNTQTFGWLTSGPRRIKWTVAPRNLQHSGQSGRDREGVLALKGVLSERADNGAALSSQHRAKFLQMRSKSPLLC